MNKDELIKLGLSEEQADNVIKGYGQMIPKSRFDEKNDEYKKALKTIEERDQQIDDLKPQAAGNEALLKQIQELQDTNKTNAEKHQAELADTRLNSAMKLALSGKVQDIDIVLGQLDKTKIELDEQGNVKAGLDDQLTTLKESKSFLFMPENEPQQQPPSWSGGQHNPPAPSNDDPFAAKLAKYE